jgi:hypothetical protein
MKGKGARLSKIEGNKGEGEIRRRGAMQLRIPN